MSNPTLARIVHPIADRQIVEKGGKVTIKEDPSTSAIKHAWDADPSIAAMHVFIDASELQRAHPSIDTSVDLGGGFSLDQVGTAADAIKLGKNASTIKKISAENGGWFVLRPADKAVKGSPCYPQAKLQPLADACNLIGILGKLQDGETYGLKKSILPSLAGKGLLSVPWQVIDARVADLETIIGVPQGSIEPADYSTGIFINFPISLWVKQGTGSDKATTLFKKEVAAASTGEGSRVANIDDFETWAGNIMNDGNGASGIVQYIPFTLDTSIKKTDAFIKQDHAASQFQSSCPADPVIVLVDHKGSIVPTEEVVKKKRKARSIASVIGSTSKANLAKWQWACALGTPPSDAAVVPRQIPFKRSLDVYRAGPRSIFIPASSIQAVTTDVARVAWNAMVMSTAKTGTPKQDAGTVALARARATSGKKRSASLENALFASGSAPAMQGSDELPVLPGRKSEPRKNGITGEVTSILKQGHVVGIETDVNMPCTYP